MNEIETCVQTLALMNSISLSHRSNQVEKYKKNLLSLVIHLQFLPKYIRYTAKNSSNKNEYIFRGLSFVVVLFVGFVQPTANSCPQNNDKGIAYETISSFWVLMTANNSIVNTIISFSNGIFNHFIQDIFLFFTFVKYQN